MSKTPLKGKRVLITRARRQAGVLAERITALGGVVIELPTIEVVAPGSFAALDGALGRIETYDWLILTSVNGVEPFLSRLQRRGRSVADLKQRKVAAIGSETAKRLQTAGIEVALVPKRFQAEGIIEALDPAEMKGKRVLIARAAQAREILPETLRRWGAEVDVVEAYRTVAPAVAVAGIKRRMRRGQLDVITFTSSSTVGNFVRLLGGGKLSEIVGTAVIACIGPITGKTVEELGGRVAITARQFTVDGLVTAMVEFFHPSGGLFPAKVRSAQRSER
jgi:uroporphyrinogen III methyltransferase/synthase